MAGRENPSPKAQFSFAGAGFTWAFRTSPTNAATFVSRDCGGVHTPPQPRTAHTTAHRAKHGAISPSATAWLCAVSEIATERTAGGSGCTPMACVRFLRRRGPAGLRDLFRFCRNCGLYILRSGLSACARHWRYQYPRRAPCVVETQGGL